MCVDAFSRYSAALFGAFLCLGRSSLTLFCPACFKEKSSLLGFVWDGILYIKRCSVRFEGRQRAGFTEQDFQNLRRINKEKGRGSAALRLPFSDSIMELRGDRHEQWQRFCRSPVQWQCVSQEGNQSPDAVCAPDRGHAVYGPDQSEAFVQHADRAAHRRRKNLYGCPPAAEKLIRLPCGC